MEEVASVPITAYAPADATDCVHRHHIERKGVPDSHPWRLENGVDQQEADAGPEQCAGDRLCHGIERFQAPQCR
jgi:hypothetical protein